MSGGGEAEVPSLRSRRRGGVAVAVAIVAVILVALVASGSRVPLAREGTGGWDLYIPSMPPPTLPPRSTDSSALVERGADNTGVGAFAVLAQVIVIMMAAALLAVSGRTLARNWRRFERVPAPPLVEREPMARPHQLVDALDEGIEAMAGGEVDDVIVACWVRLEDAAAGAGVTRLASETPSELAARVLADFDAPPDAIDALLTRYRTARYSHHRLDEHDRAVAIAALEQIRAAIVGTPA